MALQYRAAQVTAGPRLCHACKTAARNSISERRVLQKAAGAPNDAACLVRHPDYVVFDRLCAR